MALLPIILAIVAAGVLMWVVNAYIPMDARIKNLLNIVVILVLVLWLLRIFGIWGYLAEVTI